MEIFKGIIREIKEGFVEAGKGFKENWIEVTANVNWFVEKYRNWLVALFVAVLIGFTLSSVAEPASLKVLPSGFEENFTVFAQSPIQCPESDRLFLLSGYSSVHGDDESYIIAYERVGNSVEVRVIIHVFDKEEHELQFDEENPVTEVFVYGNLDLVADYFEKFVNFKAKYKTACELPLVLAKKKEVKKGVPSGMAF